jgi:hypothetical protein
VAWFRFFGAAESVAVTLQLGSGHRVVVLPSPHSYTDLLGGGSVTPVIASTCVNVVMRTPKQGKETRRVFDPAARHHKDCWLHSIVSQSCRTSLVQCHSMAYQSMVSGSLLPSPGCRCVP